MSGVRHISPLLIAYTLGAAMALFFGAATLEVERGLPLASAAPVNFSTASGHRWNLKLWPGRIFARDSMNLTFGGTGTPALSDLMVPELESLPHAPWRAMIREAAPQCINGTAFFNLQAWGFPFRSMAGGFVKGPPTQINWYFEPTIGSRTYTVPTRLIWSGLIANALIYGTLLWPMFLGLAAAARAFRARIFSRDLRCESCGYDLRGSPATSVCPECGNLPRPSPASQSTPGHCPK